MFKFFGLYYPFKKSRSSTAGARSSKGCFVLLSFLGEVAEGGHIAMMAHSGYYGGSNTGNEGFVPEILPCMDIGKVNFYCF